MNDPASSDLRTGLETRAGARQIPTGWGQAFPRAVLLSPGDLLVPAGTLRVLIARSRTIRLRYVGFALAPWIRNGREFLVSAGRAPAAGELALCDADGWVDVRRILGRAPDGAFLTALDSFPKGREPVGAGRILGVVVTGKGHAAAGRAVAFLFPIWSRLASLRYWFRKVQEAPRFGSEATASIARKYERQVEGYTSILGSPPGAETLATIRRFVPASGSILVAGSGAGRLALHLAREGYRVVGFDLVPGMVAASRRNALAMGIEAEFFQGDMSNVDLGDRRFHAVYIAPLVYSFLQGRDQRVGTLSRLGRHLEPGGAVIYSAQLLRHVSDVARLMLVWLRRVLHGDHRSEFGDWFTWFLTPEGRIGTAFSRFFSSGEVVSEGRAAGFRIVETPGPSLFLAREFAP